MVSALVVNCYLVKYSLITHRNCHNPFVCLRKVCPAASARSPSMKCLRRSCVKCLVKH